ncbi:hypothetical protein BDV27DRAFT_135989 [Aspergillus caelatus]|uniref:Uncharacterized protein n=2 Tax=Aspergillus subgen. Circumdati TaxID=2720871 RepID=A0A5N6ZPF5_9EURO|nr:uncharacterized protein BDV27DRAFT_135989 [Aspergillus caelatus]KAE8359504.1 hypothetical protein BDV27DRAFT_135989 [Aspergillus caelatus]KAE8411202.1 hypothetical protein BDV36DRAFT_275573 [Aspergillus pseudocaelatus]
MARMRYPSLVLLLSFLIIYGVAEDTKLSESLVGCDEVSCPKENAHDRCTVGDKTFLGIGLSRIPNVPSTLEGLSLIKGVNVSEGDEGKREFNSAYYLGTPSALDVNDLNGCVVTFNDPPEKQFDGPIKTGKDRNVTDVQAARGTCPDIIEQKCIDTLTERARSVTNATSNDGVCAALERELKRNTFEECGILGGKGKGLGNFTVTSFGNLSSVKNSTDCWPVKPKSDGLALITENTAVGNNTAASMYREAWKITPVLTVFVGKGNKSLVDRTSSQMTCLKVVTEENPEEEEKGSESSASMFSTSPRVAGMAMLIAAAWVAF